MSPEQFRADSVDTCFELLTGPHDPDGDLRSTAIHILNVGR
jgi:hypothetical protein